MRGRECGCATNAVGVARHGVDTRSSGSGRRDRRAKIAAESADPGAQTIVERYTRSGLAEDCRNRRIPP